MDQREQQTRNLLPFPIRRAIFGPMGALYPKLDWAPRWLRAKTTLQSLSMDHPQGYFETMSTFRSYEKPLVLTGDFRKRLGRYDTADLFRKYYEAADTTDPLSRI